ncbi:MAG: D-2-hydroxyacid dehydrogenase, partial [Novosphingobium sp.]|nr:D-2-hydroxyacid dehydrogenase [Novosphingobium sp.]
TMAEAIRRAEKLRWLVTIGAGLDYLPLDVLLDRGVMITKGAGLSAGPIAEYVVLGMLALSKQFPTVLRAQDRREWLLDSPGKRQLAGSRALVVGYGSIGRELARRLWAFDVEVTPVSRSGADGALRPGEWQARLGEFDWVVLCAPATDETAQMIGAAELAAMKPDAMLVNVARGTVVDQPALIRALEEGRIAGAMLDVTDPEPLPADNPLWAMDNVLVTMHLTGRSQDTVFTRAAERFLGNLENYRAGRPPEPVYDPAKGY